MGDSLYENSKNNLQFTNNRKNIVSAISHDNKKYETLQYDAGQIQTYDALHGNVNYFTLERPKKKRRCKKRYLLFIILVLLLAGAIAATSIVFVRFNNQLSTEQGKLSTVIIDCVLYYN